MITTLIIDEEFKNLIPPLSDVERKGLEDSILKEGCRDAIITWRGVIVDGHNRYSICTKHNIPFKTLEKDFKSRDEAILYMIDNQKSRRNLTDYARGMLESKAMEILSKQARANQTSAGAKNLERYNAAKNNDTSSLCNIAQTSEAKQTSKIDTKKELASRIGVGERTASKILNVNKHLEKAIEENKTIAGQKPEEIKQKLISGDVSINEAYNTIKKEERKELIQKQVEEIEKGNIEKPTGLFDVIAIDPPWNYGTAYSSEGRRVANPYPEMNQEQLKALEIPAKDNAVMFLWTTHKFIWDAKELLETWGFKYRCMLVWDKEKIGMGDLLRMQCEFCLIGIKGKPIFKDEHGIRDIIREPRREHSRKPDAFYELVDNLCVGDKLDFFSREHREGWCSYGNDTEKF